MWGVGGMVCDRGCCCKGVWVARCVVWGLPLQVLQGGVGGMACGMGLASAGAARGCRDMMCVGLVIAGAAMGVWCCVHLGNSHFAFS